MNERRKTSRVMVTWHEFLDSLDTDGGRIFLLFLLMLLGGIMSNWNWTSKGDDIVIGSFGALLMALKVSGSNKDRREGPPMPLPTNAGAGQSPAPAPDRAAAAPIVAAVDAAAEKVVDAIEDVKP